MRGNLTRAARHFGVTVTGEPVFGWRLRSVGATATDQDGPCWLRVVSEYPEWAAGDAWTGNVDANALTGVAKPRVLDVTEWDDQQEWRHQRAELMTLAASHACAPQRELRQDLALPDAWWATLRASLDALAIQPTTRTSVDREHIARRILAFTGIEADLDVPWTTAHGDLHWANLTAPELTILDWEHWGIAPAGYDAALLYCATLLQPDTAARVHATFADTLENPTGVAAQLAATARLLHFVDQGDHPDLAAPLHHHARELAQTRGRAARRGSPPWCPELPSV